MATILLSSLGAMNESIHDIVLSFFVSLWAINSQIKPSTKDVMKMMEKYPVMVSVMFNASHLPL